MAQIGIMELSMREVLSLRPGDLVRLPNTRITDEMVLKVGNKEKFMCRPGVVGNKVAVQITKKLEDIEKDEFEELIAEGEE
jgi:flagellar motor switch protein FliM